MKLLLITFAFILMFATFSYSQFLRIKNASLLDDTYTGFANVTLKDLQEKLSRKAHRQFRALCPTTHLDDEKDTLLEEEDDDDDTLTRFLHIPDLIEKKGKTPPPHAQDVKMLFVRLMRALYGEQPFFKKAQKERPNFEEDFIKCLFEKAKPFADEN